MTNNKWRHFLAGGSFFANLLVLAALTIGLGWTPTIVRAFAVGILAVDMVFESIILIRTWNTVSKHGTFMAGVSLMLNALALVVLIVPLGLDVDLIRWIVVFVVSLDTVVEFAAFARNGRS